MDKPHYAMICTPSNGMTTEAYDAAKKVMEEKGYRIYDRPNEFAIALRESFTTSVGEIHLAEFLLGSSILLMSVCDAVYFPKGWEDDSLSKDLYLIAFKYGLTIVAGE